MIYYVNPAYKALTGFQYSLPTQRNDFAFFAVFSTSGISAANMSNSTFYLRKPSRSTGWQNWRYGKTIRRLKLLIRGWWKLRSGCIIIFLKSICLELCVWMWKEINLEYRFCFYLLLCRVKWIISLCLRIRIRICIYKVYFCQELLFVKFWELGSQSKNRKNHSKANSSIQRKSN